MAGEPESVMGGPKATNSCTIEERRVGELRVRMRSPPMPERARIQERGAILLALEVVWFRFMSMFAASTYAVQAALLGIVLLVGLVISLFQAITQINEATLTFIPKLIAAMLALAVAGPWMLSMLVDFIRRTIETVPGSLI